MEKESLPRSPTPITSQEAFARLLGLLGPDQVQAERNYDLLRQKLISFFINRNCLDPEEYADETFSRVLKRLLEGEIIRTDTPSKYFFSVAYNLLKEHWRRIEKSPESLEDQIQPKQAAIDPYQLELEQERKSEHEAYLQCLDHCLETFPPETRELILEYYMEDGGAGIERRKLLAERFGIQINNLRIRMLRLREKLETCVRKCRETL